MKVSLFFKTLCKPSLIDFFFTVGNHLDIITSSSNKNLPKIKTIKKVSLDALPNHLALLLVRIASAYMVTFKLRAQVI